VGIFLRIEDIFPHKAVSPGTGSFLICAGVSNSIPVGDIISYADIPTSPSIHSLSVVKF